MEVARAVLPRETIATCDAGASRLLVVQKWQSFGPREFLTSNGLGSMGYAVPGALGARLAYPERPVVAFSGDGGFPLAVASLPSTSASVENFQGSEELRLGKDGGGTGSYRWWPDHYKKKRKE